MTHYPNLTAKYIVAGMFSKNKLQYTLQLTEPSGVSCRTCITRSDIMWGSQEAVQTYPNYHRQKCSKKTFEQAMTKYSATVFII